MQQHDWPHIDLRDADLTGKAQAIRDAQPFDPTFNVAVRHMADRVLPLGFDVALDDSAPYSLSELQDRVALTGRILVDGRNSDHTIYGCKEANYAFRAWHDWTHLTIRAPFTLDGELAVAHRQIEDLARIYGHGRSFAAWAPIVMGEVYGQAKYHADTGEFPADQRAFMEAWLRGIGTAQAVHDYKMAKNINIFA